MTKTFDNYEISPCRRFAEPHKPGHFFFEVCEPHEADAWTLYGHITGEGATAIGDFDTREDAADIFARITGVPFSGNHSATCRVRLSLAAPQMFAALHDAETEIVEMLEDYASEPDEDTSAHRTLATIRAAINLATQE